jgi:hypothetical protein
MSSIERDIKIRRVNALQISAFDARRNRKFGEAAFKMLDAATAMDQLDLPKAAKRLRLSAAFLEYREGRKNYTEGFPLLGAVWYKSSGLHLLGDGRKEGRLVLEKVRMICERSGTVVAKEMLEAIKREEK